LPEMLLIPVQPPQVLLPGLGPLASTPDVLTETRVVEPAVRSRTKMSLTPLRSRLTRLLAFESNATYRPSLDIRACHPGLVPLPAAPDELTETSCVVPATRSRTNNCSFVSLPPRTPLPVAANST